jgi:hypothetical protein
MNMDIVEQIAKLKSEQEALGYEVMLGDGSTTSYGWQYCNEAGWHDAISGYNTVPLTIYRRRKPPPQAGAVAVCGLQNQHSPDGRHRRGERTFSITEKMNMDNVELIMKLKAEQEAAGYEFDFDLDNHDRRGWQYFSNGCWYDCIAGIWKGVFYRRLKPEPWFYAACYLAKGQNSATNRTMIWHYTHPVSHDAVEISIAVEGFGGIEYAESLDGWQSTPNMMWFPRIKLLAPAASSCSDAMPATPKRVRILNPEWKG